MGGGGEGGRCRIRSERCIRSADLRAHLGGLLGYSSVKSIVSLKRPPSQIVLAFPGITHSHAMMFCEPSSLLLGFATKP